MDVFAYICGIIKRLDRMSSEPARSTRLRLLICDAPELIGTPGIAKFQ